MAKPAITVPTRRAVLTGLSALPLVSLRTRPAGAAEVTLKLVNAQNPSHPINLRLAQAADRIRTASGGRLELRLFPESQLGSEIDLISQLRSGAVDIMNVSALVLSSTVAASSLVNTGFAFPTLDKALAAVDGPVGAYVKTEIEKAGFLMPFRTANSGFRQITSAITPIRTPADLQGFRIRVPVSPLNLSLFKSLGAAPTTVNFSETYTALQTGLVQGQENPLVIIENERIYEVQKCCSLTNHIWDAYWLPTNRRSFARLSKDLQDLLVTEINRAVMEERADTAQLDSSLLDKLKAKGMEVVTPDEAAFRAALLRTDFYKTWRVKFGAAAWTLLEGAAGNLG